MSALLHKLPIIGAIRTMWLQAIGANWPRG